MVLSYSCYILHMETNIPTTFCSCSKRSKICFFVMTTDHAVETSSSSSSSLLEFITAVSTALPPGERQHRSFLAREAIKLSFFVMTPDHAVETSSSSSTSLLDMLLSSRRVNGSSAWRAESTASLCSTWRTAIMSSSLRRCSCSL
jgi:hypothetical protein